MNISALRKQRGGEVPVTLSRATLTVPVSLRTSQKSNHGDGVTL